MKVAVITDQHLDGRKGSQVFWNYFNKFYDEIAFHIELAFAVILIPAALLLPVSLIVRILLILSVLLVIVHRTA